MMHPRQLRFGFFALLLLIGTFANLPVTQASGYSVRLEISQALCFDYGDPFNGFVKQVDVLYTIFYTAPDDLEAFWVLSVLAFSPATSDTTVYGTTDNMSRSMGAGWTSISNVSAAEVEYPFSFVMSGRLMDGIGGDYNSYPLDPVLLAEASFTGTCIGPGEAIIGSTAGQDAPFNPGDGRLQPQAGAPVAVYCREGAVEIYAINSASEGELALNVEPEALNGDAPSENELIASEGDIRLYRLSTGELQVNVGADAEGKEYVMIWDGCGEA